MLNWAGSLTISSYLVIREGWTAKTTSSNFCGHSNWTVPWEGSVWVQSKKGHSKCNIPWECFILSAGEIRNLLKNIHMYLWNQVFSPLKLNCSLGIVQFECRKKQATQIQIIYILDSGLDSGLIQFIYWIRALIRAWYNLYTGFGP